MVFLPDFPADCPIQQIVTAFARTVGSKGIPAYSHVFHTKFPIVRFRYKSPLRCQLRHERITLTVPR